MNGETSISPMNIILSDYIQRLVKDLKCDVWYRFYLKYNPMGDYFNILIYYNAGKQPIVITINNDLYNCGFKNYREFLFIIRNKLMECL